MLISLYTSRVILQALGVEDYGIYNVVGGVVAMLSVITGALTTTISRFITYEIGSGDKERLNKVFSTSKVVQLIMTMIVIILIEIVGMWFLRAKMQIPEGRMTAAIWVLNFSLLSFCVDLISIPYNACIVAHEHMKAFAYVSIIQAIAKLGICFIIMSIPFDRLIAYAALMLLVSIGVRLFYSIYCHHHFDESKARLKFHKETFKEMFSFAGWSFFNNGIYIINTQGVNMLINVYYGVVFNAARGIANQVEGAVISFVNSFTTAINPQITKCYAAGELDEMYTLVSRGARFSYYLMFIMALPIICETDAILGIWLVDVPEKASVFIKLSLVNVLIDCVGNSSYTANVATGKIKLYSILVSVITILIFPITWIVYSVGGAIETPYVIYIGARLMILVVRMALMKKYIGFSVLKFIKDAYIPVILTTVLASLPSLLILQFVPSSSFRFVLSLIVGVSMVALTAFCVGMTSGERSMIVNKGKMFYHKIINR